MEPEMFYLDGVYLDWLDGMVYAYEERSHQSKAIQSLILELLRDHPINKETMEKIKLIYQGFQCGLSNY